MIACNIRRPITAAERGRRLHPFDPCVDCGGWVMPNKTLVSDYQIFSRTQAFACTLGQQSSEYKLIGTQTVAFLLFDLIGSGCRLVLVFSWRWNTDIFCQLPVNPYRSREVLVIFG